MAKMAICKICKMSFDRDAGIENEDWMVRPGTQRSYVHVACQKASEDVIKNKSVTKKEYSDDFWFDSVYVYMEHQLKISLDFTRFKRTWSGYLKKGFTAKGIYYALRYFFDIKNGDRDKANHGIGIVPYCYTDAKEYWTKIESAYPGRMNAILEQQLAMQNMQVIKIQPKKRKKKVIEDWE